jgi:hypothetical protein
VSVRILWSCAFLLKIKRSKHTQCPGLELPQTVFSLPTHTLFSHALGYVLSSGVVPGWRNQGLKRGDSFFAGDLLRADDVSSLTSIKIGSVGVEGAPFVPSEPLQPSLLQRVVPKMTQE